ncbi:3'-5' exonuclease, partial [Bifidobacterium longum]
DASQRSAVNAVGDPFQSIYAWRGASPGAFRMFQQDFHLSAGYKPFPLSVTRRNSRIVLEAANNLTLPLRSNPSRPSSSLMREVDVSSLDPMPDAPEGTLGVLGFATAGQEIDAVVRFCKTAIARHRSAAEQQEQMPGEQKAPVAVLFRSKSHMPEYQAALEQAGLTTFVVGYSALLERPEIRDLMALLHVAADHTDTGSLMRLLATPRFTMSAADLTMLARFAEEQNTEQRFQALVQAGLAQPDTPANEWAAVVREYRDQVANAVFLPDVLLR